MNHIISDCLANASEKSYNNHWASFSKFMFETFHLSPMLATSYHVSLYITFLHSCNLQPSTVRSYLSAISFTHKLHGNQDPTNCFRIRKLIEAFKRKSHNAYDRKPIKRCLLKKMVRRLKKVTHTEYDRWLFNAIFIIMYHACLRVSEVARSSNSKHTMSFKQMFIRGGKLVLCLKSYKHSNQRTSKIVLPACKGCICPVRAYKKYKKLRKRIPGPFFLKENGKAASRNVIAKMLKKVIEALSLNPKHFNTHSFRIGKITDLATTGSSSNKIKSAGRFHSNAYLNYIKPGHVTIR